MHTQYDGVVRGVPVVVITVVEVTTVVVVVAGVLVVVVDKMVEVSEVVSESVIVSKAVVVWLVPEGLDVGAVVVEGAFVMAHSQRRGLCAASTNQKKQQQNQQNQTFRVAVDMGF